MLWPLGEMGLLKIIQSLTWCSKQVSWSKITRPTSAYHQPQWEVKVENKAFEDHVDSGRRGDDWSSLSNSSFASACIFHACTHARIHVKYFFQCCMVSSLNVKCKCHPREILKQHCGDVTDSTKHAMSSSTIWRSSTDSTKNATSSNTIWRSSTSISRSIWSAMLSCPHPDTHTACNQRWVNNVWTH